MEVRMVLLYLIDLFEYCVLLNCFSIELVWNGIIDWILLFHLIVHDFNWIMILNRIEVCVISISELLMRLNGLIDGIWWYEMVVMNIPIWSNSIWISSVYLNEYGYHFDMYFYLNLWICILLDCIQLISNRFMCWF